MRLFSVAVWVLAICVGCAAERTDIQFGGLKPGPRSLDYKPRITTWVLPNKLTVAVMPDDQVNLVSVEVRYTVGAADDPPGKDGLAHLVEHLMFERQGQDGRGTLWNQLARAALSHNAATYDDFTHYYAIGLASKLDDLLAIDRERMAGGCKGIDQAALDHERAVVLDEALQNHHDEHAQLRRALFGPDHAYSRFAGSTEVARITLDDVCRFIDAHYAPDRAILVVSGQVPREIVRTISASFGSIQRQAMAKQVAVAPLHWAGQMSQLVTDLVDAPSVMVVFPDALWGSKDWIYDQMMWRLTTGFLRDHQSRFDWMLSIDRHTEGGVRGGASGVVIKLKDIKYADRAIEEVFATIHELHTSVNDEAWIRTAGAEQSWLLENLESIHDRGTLAASYLQFTTHGQFQLYQLGELQHVDRTLLYSRAELRTRNASRIVRLVPPINHDRTGHLTLTGALAELDNAGDHVVVDPGEAERPIAFTPDARPSEIRERQLANGLRVIMLANARQPVFEARLVFPVGNTTELDGKRGIGIAAAELLNNDWERRLTPHDQATIDWVLRTGTPVQHRVSAAATTFSVSGFSLFADAELWRLHWLLDNGIFDPIKVAHYREVVPSQIRRDENDARDQALDAALYGADHPYVRTAGADARIATAKATTTSDLGNFRDTFYRARGATLILVGNFDPAAMDRQVDELFGTWTAAPAPAPAPIPAMQPPAQPTWLTVQNPKDSQVRVTLDFPATSTRGKSAAARAILAQILRDRVHLVRARFGASYGVRANYQTTLAGDFIEIDGELDAARAGDALRLIQGALASLRTGDAALAREFVLARRTALASALADPLRSGVTASRIERAVVLGLPLAAGRNLPAELAATTLKDVQALIAQDLDPAHMVGMVSGQPGDIDKALEAVKSR